MTSSIKRKIREEQEQVLELIDEHAEIKIELSDGAKEELKKILDFDLYSIIEAAFSVGWKMSAEELSKKIKIRIYDSENPGTNEQ